MIIIMKNDELFFIKQNGYRYDVINNKGIIVGGYEYENEIEDDLNENNYEIINVNNEIVDNLHKLIYTYVNKKYLNDYFKVGEDLKNLMPFGFFHQPLIVNIATEFIKNSNGAIILNNKPLKYFELIDFSLNVFNSNNISGFGKTALSDLIITFIELGLNSLKYNNNIDKQILYYFYLINSTIPEEERLNNDDFYDFYFNWLNKDSKLRKGVLNFVFNDVRPIIYLKDIVNIINS